MTDKQYAELLADEQYAVVLAECLLEIKKKRKIAKDHLLLDIVSAIAVSILQILLLIGIFLSIFSQ